MENVKSLCHDSDKKQEMSVGEIDDKMSNRLFDHTLTPPNIQKSHLYLRPGSLS